MNKSLLKICIGGLSGIGVGLFVSKHKIDQLEAKRDELELSNKCLEANHEFTQICIDNLKANNELLTNLLLQERKTEET